MPFTTPNGSSITCPRCGMTSFNPNDVRNNYCGNCHIWLADPTQQPIVHLLHRGLPACRFTYESPVRWPLGHVWASLDNARNVTCPQCIARLKDLNTYGQ